VVHTSAAQVSQSATAAHFTKITTTSAVTRTASTVPFTVQNSTISGNITQPVPTNHDEERPGGKMAADALVISTAPARSR